MGLNQLNFEGRDKVQVAIMRIQEFEPPEGYYLAFSGGKDSITIYDLAVKAGVKFDAHYNMTGIDPPELVKFIRSNFPDVENHRPPESIWNLIQTHGMPRRNGRWCCEKFKEIGGSGRFVITGIRWAESSRRRRRRMVEVCMADKTKVFIHPVIDWETSDVWDYIHSEHLPYCSLYDEGFKRLGCVLCPMTSREQAYRDIQRWPKIADAWKRAATRYWERQTPGMKRFSSAEHFWQWWLSREALGDHSQCVMFDN